MSITRGNAENYVTDEMTVSGRTISIKINEQGYYRIDVAGSGDKPELCNHIFTSLSEARKAVSAYVSDNRAAIEKKKMIMEIAQREYPMNKNKGKNAKTSTE
jgi:hypothetical protein